METALFSAQFVNEKPLYAFVMLVKKILNDTWYTSKLSDEKKKRERIVPTAGAILLEDMQLMTYDTTVFPPSDNFCSGAEKMVPQTLKALMDSLSGKKRDDEKMRKKLTAIAHAIISTIRPRSFLSPILHGIALFVNRKFGSKSLISLLPRLGTIGTVNHLSPCTAYTCRNILSIYFRQYRF
ncbi:hypothetical protein AVEN_23269-1 [Araneus ventricosus]|uniref:Uncharacterized protein n=1 Tax=Araneus ventricosus TaxID=182803 RepID=A0A4Y2P5W5_ARAVE|nr:hypothetical protein AVEN_23269-1 [Araneus ventricosus]